MTQSMAEIRTMSGDMLARERAAAGGVSETTPVSLTPALEAFCQSLGGEPPVFVPVVDDTYGLFGWCSDGVAEKVKAEQGGTIFGWTIWEWPNVLWTAEFHAVWRSPKGDLIDITPKPKRETRILFVADLSYPETFNFDHRPRNRRKCAYVPADPAQTARERIAALKPAQLAYEQRRAEKAGLSLQKWFEAKVLADKLAPLIDEAISACDAHEEYFDSLGISGNIPIDAKLAGYMQRRFAALAALKQAVEKKPSATLGTSHPCYEGRQRPRTHGQRL